MEGEIEEMCCEVLAIIPREARCSSAPSEHEEEASPRPSLAVVWDVAPLLSD